MRKGLLSVLLVLLSASSLLAHHSLANFDVTTPVRAKGTVVQFHLINPHSIIFLEEKTADGQIRRWAVEGPAIRQLERSGRKNLAKVGDVIEVCGYLPKEAVMWQMASPDPRAIRLTGRLINAELLVLADGKEHSWGDYGSHKCFPPGYTDQHSSR